MKDEALFLAEKLAAERRLDPEEYAELIRRRSESTAEYLRERAEAVRKSAYGTDVFIRGLIEISNYCKNDCYYCGIRRSNKRCERYRLSAEEILDCCKSGYALGFRTFVLQGGEDPFYTDDLLCGLIASIKARFPDCAVTLSLGERGKQSFKRLFDAGADRYLLRHETADAAHYAKLHPAECSFENRMRCLYDLREIGYQVGCGFMVGSPCQTPETLAKDLRFLETFRPEMCGIGPFIPQKDTPFGDKASGSTELTLFLLSVIRLILPNVLLPATTALATLDPRGREKGISAGANVIMPNLSPLSAKKKYTLYDGKVCTGEESARCIACLEKRMDSIGYKIVVSRGDPCDKTIME